MLQNQLEKSAVLLGMWTFLLEMLLGMWTFLLEMLLEVSKMSPQGMFESLILFSRMNLLVFSSLL